jgi:proline iminopeptidase
MNGMPPHICQLLLGHSSITTTMGYQREPIYPEDVIAHHRAFIARRRTERPSEEYRDLTATEWGELVLWGVTTTTRHEVDWLTWSMGEIYPEAFAELLALVPGLERGGNLPAACNRLLMSPDADLQDRAARSWCAWEDRLATLHGPPRPSPRYADATFRLGFARLVTHFFGHHAFLPADGISGRIDHITGVPAVLVRGRLDIASPLGVAWRLAQQLPLATLHVVEDEDHGGAESTGQLLVQATNRFAD